MIFYTLVVIFLSPKASLLNNHIVTTCILAIHIELHASFHADYDFSPLCL